MNIKALIRLRGCAGWSVLLKKRRHIFSRRGQYIKIDQNCSVQEITRGNPILVKSDISKCWCDLENKITPPPQTMYLCIWLKFTHYKKNSLHMMVTSKIRSKSPKSNQLSPSFGQSPFTGSEEDRTETKQRVKADTRIYKQTRDIYVSRWKGRETYCFSCCLRPSVCLSVTKSCPLFNLKTVRVISTKLHTFVRHIQTMCHAQDP